MAFVCPHVWPGCFDCHCCSVRWWLAFKGLIYYLSSRSWGDLRPISQGVGQWSLCSYCTILTFLLALDVLFPWALPWHKNVASGGSYFDLCTNPHGHAAISLFSLMTGEGGSTLRRLPPYGLVWHPIWWRILQPRGNTHSPAVPGGDLEQELPQVHVGVAWVESSEVCWLHYGVSQLFMLFTGKSQDMCVGSSASPCSAWCQWPDLYDAGVPYLACQLMKDSCHDRKSVSLRRLVMILYVLQDAQVNGLDQEHNDDDELLLDFIIGEIMKNSTKTKILVSL
jgi:hypothetical protein